MTDYLVRHYSPNRFKKFLQICNFRRQKKKTKVQFQIQFQQEAIDVLTPQQVEAKQVQMLNKEM